MKCSELKKLLRAIGCFFVRHGGRHDLWSSPLTGLIFAIPRHESQEIPAGTLNVIKKQAGF